MPKISVIVPVYKVENYLTKCIDSILAQTFSDFELILVDDCSPDNCPAICDQYMQKDIRVKVIHQANGGVSVARNTGIRRAQGDYLVFVDSDDYVDLFYLEELYKIHELGADIAICGYYVVHNEHKKDICIDKSLLPQCIGITKDLFQNIIKNDLLYSPCNKMFKRKIITDNKIFFDSNMMLGEDLCFNIDYLYYCEKCFICNIPLYYYLRLNSTLSKNIKLDYFDIQKFIYEKINKFIQIKQIKYNLLSNMESLLNDTLGTLVLSKNKNNKNDIYIKLKQILHDDLINTYILNQSVNNSKNLMYYLLKIKSIFLISTYFSVKNKLGKIYRLIDKDNNIKYIKSS